MHCCRTASTQMLPLIFALLIALRSDVISAVVLNATAVPAVVTTATVTTAHSPTTATTTTTTSTTTTTTATTTTTTATTAKAAVTTATTKAHKPRRPCAFPFWHRGQWHHECLEYGAKGARWCSLTQNFTRDEEWRECARYDLMRYKCTIPFRYRAELHNQCLPLSLEPVAKLTFWCSLVPNIVEVVWTGLGTDWVFCEAPNATDAAYLKAVGPHLSLKEALATKAAPAVTAAHIVATVAVATTAAPPAAHPTSSHVSAAAPETSKSKSVAFSDGASAAAASGGGTAADASSGGATAVGSWLGIALGIVGVLLAAVAVAAGFILHRRYFRHHYKRIDPLLSSEPATEKSSYGGMQAYHD